MKTNYTGTIPLTYSWLPTTGLSNATIANPVVSGGAMTYTLTVTTQNGCKASDDVNIILIKKAALEICMVGVDSITGKNKIIWNHPISTTVNVVEIFKENTVNNFVKIAEVPYTQGEFIDSASQPNVKSDRYKISILDSCGLESVQSNAHKTIDLTVNKGTNGSWILRWEIYEGVSASTYLIYRGRDKSNLQLYGSASGAGTSQLTFTDIGPISGIMYYQVEAKNPNPCDAVNGTSIRSNAATGSPVGIIEYSNESNFSIYPNPANDQLTIDVENGVTQNLSLTIYNEIGGVVKTVSIHQIKQQFDISELSNGFYLVELKSLNGSSVQKLTIEK